MYAITSSKVSSIISQQGSCCSAAQLQQKALSPTHPEQLRPRQHTRSCSLTSCAAALATPRSSSSSSSSSSTRNTRAASSVIRHAANHALQACSRGSFLQHRQRQQQQQQQQQQQRLWLSQPHPGARYSTTTTTPTAPTHVCRVLTESADMALGAAAPDFELLEPLTGRKLSLSALSSGAKATLVMFICNHCPFVVMLKEAITKLAQEYQAKGVAVVAISSNSVETHPQDGPDKMAEDAKRYGYTFPYLFDESQSVAKAYKAACTPEFYVFNSSLGLTYHGQFDDARPNSNKLVTGSDLRTALDATLAGNALPEGFKVKPSIGCNIKWTPGSEPAYYGEQIVKK